MHDGSIATLGEVVDHYAAGGRMGHDNPSKDPLVHGFFMTPQNRADLIAFLESLTDQDVVHDPKFADPWTSEVGQARRPVLHSLLEFPPRRHRAL